VALADDEIEEGGIAMRRVLFVLCGVLVVSLISGPASAAVAPTPNDDGVVVMSGDVAVAQGETVDAVVVFSGAVTVEGTVRNDVIVFSGPVTISGDVRGNVVVFDGLLTLQNGAHVWGDVLAGRRLISPGAQVDGTTSSAARIGVAAGWAGVAIWIAMCLAIAVSLLLLGFLLLWFAPRAADAVIVTGRTAVGPSIGWGAAMVFGLPVIAVIAMVTVVGLPIGLGLLFSLGLIYAVGMVAGAWFLGRAIVKHGSRAGAFAVGWLIVTGASLLPGLGGLVWIAATGYGLGMLCVAAFRARREPPTMVPEAAQAPSTPEPSTPVTV
jgi:hypothetical protein